MSVFPKMCNVCLQRGFHAADCNSIGAMEQRNRINDSATIKAQAEEISALKAHVEDIRNCYEIMHQPTYVISEFLSASNRLKILLVQTPKQSLEAHDKKVATEFFYWWYNQGGTNTQDGFDTWYKLKSKDGE